MPKEVPTMSDDEDAVMEEVQERPVRTTAPRTDTLPWVEKYRPKDFSELIAHGDIISTCIHPILIYFGYSITTILSNTLARKIMHKDHTNNI